MKDFFKMLLACLVALMLAGGLMMIMGLFFIGVLASMGDSVPVVPQRAVLVFDLAANIADAPRSEGGPEALAEALGGGSGRQYQLRKVVDAIDAASADDRIKGLYLHGSFAPQSYGTGYGALLEVRAAVERFRAAGKPVLAYLVAPTHRDYLLASSASRIVFDPLGMMLTPGLSAEVLYYGGAFSKYGIGVQIARAGDYKSYGESYVLDHMSEAEREQLTSLLGDVWRVFVERVASSRGIAPETVQEAIDTHGLLGPRQAVEAGLIDAELGFSGVLAELKEMAGDKPETKTFAQVSLSAYIGARDRVPKGALRSRQIAVVYVEGAIVDGEGSAGSAGGDRIARELRRLRQDEKVKAVVLRVNSPGGSAIASDVIRRELVALREKMPVVVSMGSVAASGGYWVSTAADRVFAQDNTITGSIGVVAMIPNIEGLAERFSLNFEQVKTGRHADIFSIATPRDEASMAVLQARVDEVYEMFLDHVCEGRALERATVRELAGGRVWSGTASVASGLVDEIGGLHAAIADAARRAGLDTYSVSDHPAARSFVEEFLEKLSRQEAPMSSQGPSREVRRMIDQTLGALDTFNDPRGVYARLPFVLHIN